MAKYDAQIGDLKNHLNNAKNILIALPATITVDKLAAGLSLMLSLEAQGKEVTVITKDTLKVSHTNLFGVGKVRDQLAQNASGNFIVSLEGVVDANGLIPALEKLDWYPEGQNLNLVFHVVPGYKFEPTNISSHYQNSGFNLLFVIGATSLNDLGEVYPLNIQQFTGVPIVNIDNSPTNSNFGYINVVDPNAASVSEMVMQILSAVGLPVDGDIATNILTGIYDVTANLTTNVKPDSFISVGLAMQAGGKTPQQVSQPQPIPAMSQPQTTSQLPPVPEPSAQGLDLRQVLQIPPTPFPQPNLTDNFINPPVVGQPAQSVSTQEAPVREYATSQSMETESTNPAPDWLTPKIFKGGSLG